MHVAWRLDRNGKNRVCVSFARNSNIKVLLYGTIQFDGTVCSCMMKFDAHLKRKTSLYEIQNNLNKIQLRSKTNFKYQINLIGLQMKSKLTVEFQKNNNIIHHYQKPQLDTSLWKKSLNRNQIIVPPQNERNAFGHKWKNELWFVMGNLDRKI